MLVNSIPPRLDSGAGLRSYGVAAALAHRAAVQIAFVSFEGRQAATEYGALERVQLRPLMATRGPRRGLRYVRARRIGVPSDWARGVSEELARAADGAPLGVQVIADGPVAAAALLPLARRRHVVYLAQNVESAFRTASGSGDVAGFERLLLRTFAESWMATRADQRGASQLAGKNIVTRYVPNVIDLERVTPVRMAGSQRLLLVADFTYPPNREALAYLLEDVMPRVWNRRPQAQVMLVGRGLKTPPSDHRVQQLGFLPELRPVYAAADLAVIPLLHGGGSPLKFVEALAYALPVVATPHAARLLEDGVPGEHFLAGAGGDGFAQAILQVLEDPKHHGALGAAGRELVARSYSVDSLASLLAA